MKLKKMNLILNENNEKQESSDDEIDISDYLTDDDIPDYNLKLIITVKKMKKQFLMQQEHHSINFLKNQLHSFSFKMKN